MILPEVTANPWAYIRGVQRAKLTMFCIFFKIWGTAWGTISGSARPLLEIGTQTKSFANAGSKTSTLLSIGVESHGCKMIAVGNSRDVLVETSHRSGPG